MNTRLVLIRHGITAWNKEKRYCGRIDVGLSREGKRQAKKLASALKGIGFDKIYSSDKKRALETCRIVFGKSKFTKVKGLREINFGVLEGLRHKAILKKYGALYENWVKDPHRHHIPKAEKLRDFKERICGQINQICRANPDKTVAVVCHGGVIGIFVSSLLKSRKFWQHIPKPASVTVVEYKRDGSQLKAKLSPKKGHFKIGLRTVPTKKKWEK
ncbi:MAG: histidine phosphatase family protein [Candidatus Omnitrophota bacterium]